ncbi:MAG: LOG family protein [Deltaproteobacteria bacterium]|nr:LOG family protein [Deltaproteobacteria bacterium]
MSDMKIKIGVMGSASGPVIKDPESQKRAFGLGQAIAKNECICITGACPGLPANAAEGAKQAGGFVLGISPAFSKREHIDIYSSPIEPYDMILFSGLGLMERDIINIRSCDAIVVIGGGMGTLNEFTVAYEEKKPVGILTGTGGISGHIPEILGFANRQAGPDRIIYEEDPELLIEKLLAVVTRTTPPLRESDIGGQKEAPTFEQAENIRRAQRKDHDLDRRKTDEDESV